MGEVDAALMMGPPQALPQVHGAVDARVRALVDAHFDVVWRTLCRCGVPEAGVDDAAQQVFLVATRKLDLIEEATERAYLLGIAVRVAADARRTQRRRREVPHDDEAMGPLLGDGPASPEELVDQKRARELLDAVLASMPDDARDVFVLFEIEGVPLAQIAETLAIPVGTVSSRIRRARELFQKKVNRLSRSEPLGASR
jgi:RNA polymerase sigma-70 factor, ECF subfamily